MAGADPMTIQQLGGWKTLQMVQRYAHLSPDHKRQAIERLSVLATNALRKRGEHHRPTVLGYAQHTGGDSMVG